MANVQAMTSAFKRDLLKGFHNIGGTDNPARSVNTTNAGGCTEGCVM